MKTADENPVVLCCGMDDHISNILDFLNIPASVGKEGKDKGASHLCKSLLPSAVLSLIHGTSRENEREEELLQIASDTQPKRVKAWQNRGPNTRNREEVCFLLCAPPSSAFGRGAGFVHFF